MIDFALVGSCDGGFPVMVSKFLGALQPQPAGRGVPDFL